MDGCVFAWHLSNILSPPLLFSTFERESATHRWGILTEAKPLGFSIFPIFFCLFSWTICHTDVRWKEPFMVGWKRWYQRWPPQIERDLRATPSPMIELNTRASMVEGLCLKSRDTCFWTEVARWTNTPVHICIHMSESRYSSLSLSDLLPRQQSLHLDSLSFFPLLFFFQESNPLLFFNAAIGGDTGSRVLFLFLLLNFSFDVYDGQTTQIKWVTTCQSEWV